MQIPDRMPWWLNYISCPSCGAAPESQSVAVCEPGYCKACHCGWTFERNALIWENSTTTRQKSRWGNLWRRIKNQFNPMTSLLSPIRLISNRRVDHFYKRTISDHDLAKRWENHYLGGLDLKEGDSILDHGCGRGRHIALATQLGYRVVGQDVTFNAWWNHLSANTFQIVPVCRVIFL